MGHDDGPPNGAVAALLPDGRLHLQHGPIDLVIGADGAPDAGRTAADAMWARFRTVLDELVAELAVLRSDVRDGRTVDGAVAARMVAAARAARRPRFLTPMAAVAGAVGGVATSGRSGRSLSLGIADAVTVLAADAARADALATVIANAVDLPGHAAVVRRPALEVRHDSDLGRRPVVCAVGHLADREVAAALDAGERVALAALADGRAAGAVLALRGQRRVLGAAATAALDGPGR